MDTTRIGLEMRRAVVSISKCRCMYCQADHALQVTTTFIQLFSAWSEYPLRSTPPGCPGKSLGGLRAAQFTAASRIPMKVLHCWQGTDLKTLNDKCCEYGKHALVTRKIWSGSSTRATETKNTHRRFHKKFLSLLSSCLILLCVFSLACYISSAAVTSSCQYGSCLRVRVAWFFSTIKEMCGSAVQVTRSHLHYIFWCRRISEIAASATSSLRSGSSHAIDFIYFFRKEKQMI